MPYSPPSKTLVFSSGSPVVRNSANVAGDATASTLATITIPGGKMGPNGSLRISVYESHTNSASTKTVRARIGGTGGTLVFSESTTTSLSNNPTKVIHNANSQSAQAFSPSSNVGIGIATSGTLGTAAINTANDFDVVIECLWGAAASGENITLVSYLVEVFYGA